MGSAASKATRSAGGVAARKYPTRPSPATRTAAPAQRAPQPVEPGPGPTVHPNSAASETRDQTINLDASDPVLASKLRQIGPVEANPYQSHTSAQSQSQSPKFKDLRIHDQVGPPPGVFPDAVSMRNNPAFLVLQARSRLQDKADQEFSAVGKRGFEGREFMDVWMVTDALKMRRAGVEMQEIERKLGLKKGIVEKLGGKGVLETGYA